MRLIERIRGSHPEREENVREYDIPEPQPMRMPEPAQEPEPVPA